MDTITLLNFVFGILFGGGILGLLLQLYFKMGKSEEARSWLKEEIERLRKLVENEIHEIKLEIREIRHKISEIERKIKENCCKG